MEQLNLNLPQQFWAIAKPFWVGDQKWRVRGLLLLVVVLSLGYTGLSVVLNNQRGALISALSAQDEARFWQVIVVFTGVLVIYAPLFAGYVYLRDRLGLKWRNWLTNYVMDRYFENRAFYRVNHAEANTGASSGANSGANSEAQIDNPDQRIAEDVKSFTQESLTLLLAVVDSLLAIAAFGGVLWSISKSLIVFLVLYALVGTLATVGVFGKKLVQLNFDQIKKEADFRFGLVRVRENAEAIAFYQGEGREAEQLKGRFSQVFDNFKRLLFWELNLNAFSNAYEFIPFILPAIVVAPGIFAGELEVGKVSEAQGAFIRVFFSLNLIVARFQSLATFGAGVQRLFSFSSAIEQPTQAQPTQEQPTQAQPVTEQLQPEQRLIVQSDGLQADQNGPQILPVIAASPISVIQTETAAMLALESMTLQTPNRQRTLIKQLSLQLLPGEGLLVKGPSGCGKSSLLRAIAGLWQTGSGKVKRPPLSDMLFLPQRPYMILGTLRDQILYPKLGVEMAEAQLQEILARVNLANLQEQHGGFETEQDWSEVLSLGEQQRLIFARLLLNQPAYAILDEATSALDTQNEALLYEQLQNSGITYLSVGHRPTLDRYHQTILNLTEHQTWSIETTVNGTPKDTLSAPEANRASVG